MAEKLLKSNLILPALEYVLKCSHIFNILDSSGSVGVTERTAYMLKVRQLAIAIAQAYVAEEPRAARGEGAPASEAARSGAEGPPRLKNGS
jgi:glycyl-tRNA synthetase alpha subunit